MSVVLVQPVVRCLEATQGVYSYREDKECIEKLIMRSDDLECVNGEASWTSTDVVAWRDY